MNPLYKWSGGKRSELKYFKKYYPKNFDVYVEPFFGAGAVFFDLLDDVYRNTREYCIGDVHDEVICFFNVLKWNQEDLVKELSKDIFKNTKEDYYHIRDNYKQDTPIEKAARFFYLRKTSFRGMLRYNSNEKFNIPFGMYDGMFTFNELINLDFNSLFKNVEFYNKDFEKLFNLFKDDEDAFIFLDPPYDCEFKKYKFDFDREDQIRLSELFKNSKSKNMLIISKTDFINDLYKDYIRYEYHKNYLFKILDGRVDQQALHLVVTNYTDFIGSYQLDLFEIL